MQQKYHSTHTPGMTGGAFARYFPYIIALSELFSMTAPVTRCSYSGRTHKAQWGHVSVTCTNSQMLMCGGSLMQALTCRWHGTQLTWGGSAGHPVLVAAGSPRYRQ